MSGLTDTRVTIRAPRRDLCCSKCGQPHERVGRYRFDCHAAYMRDWRKINKMEEGQRERDGARSYANIYKKRGLIQPAPCVICGSGKSEMHHPNHEQPLLITWLCRPCHLAWHTFSRMAIPEMFEWWIGRAHADLEKKSRAA
jgi:hypothetical protein